MCDEKWIHMTTGQLPAQWLDREEAPKHFPKPNLHQKKVMVTGGLLPVWPTTAFWIPGKTNISEKFSKLTRCTENCRACSWQWSTERAQFFSSTMSNHTLHNQHFKSWTNRAIKFCLSHHIHLASPQLTTISLRISTTFCRKNISTTTKRQKMPSKSLLSKRIPHW